MNNGILIKSYNYKDNFLDYEKLKTYTNNIILEFNENYTNEFKRSIFELSRLDMNIGIFIDSNIIKNDFKYLNNLIDNIKGFDIKLGIWVYGCNWCDIINILEDINKYDKHFILGIVGNTNYKFNLPVWKNNGDIETLGILKLDYLDYELIQLKLNTDYKTIYEENNLKPILSTYKFNSYGEFVKKL